MADILSTITLLSLSITSNQTYLPQKTISCFEKQGFVSPGKT